MRIKRVSLPRLVGALAAIGLLATPLAASAQGDGRFYFSGRPYDPYSYYLDGPPDASGCMPECARDFSPCDPPYFKKADNRCGNRSRR